MEFWNARAPREKLILIIGAALLGLFILWQFVIAPIFAAKATAERARDNAMRDYVIVRDGVGVMGQASETAANKAPFERAAIINTAQTLGLPLSRVQPEGDGVIKVWFEDVSGPSVFSFVERLGRSYASEVTRAQISRNEDGTVSAQITFKAIG